MSLVYLFTVKRKVQFRLKNCNFEAAKNEFEMILCTSDEHLIAKVYKIWLHLNLENEYVKNCMIQWARNFAYNVRAMGKYVD